MRTVSSPDRAVAAPLPFAAVLRSALLGGAVAGLVAVLVSWLLVEAPIRAALAIEESRAAAGDEGETFGRATQVIGGMLAALLVGLVLGLVFAVVFGWLRYRLSGRTDFGRAVSLAAAGFAVVSLLPAIKYPANPPGVGDPETVGTRTLYYLSFLAAAIVVAVVAFAIREWLGGRWPASRAVTAAAVVAVAGYALLVGLWPASPDAIPADVPAGLIWRFRLSSLAELAVLWSVLGFVTGLLLERRSSPVPSSGYDAAE